METVTKYGRWALTGVVIAHKYAVAFCEQYPSATTWLVYAMAIGLLVMRFV